MNSKIQTVLQGEDLFCSLPDDRKICYRRFGNSGDEPLVLIAGLGLQLIYWPPNLIQLLVLYGYQVIVFDNRDVGRSSSILQPTPTRFQILLRRPNAKAYDLSDMANDLVYLLNHLNIHAAHLVGMSMGGMIAQTFAAKYPDRSISLTSIFSTTGALNVGQPNKFVSLLMLRKPVVHRKAWIKNYIYSAKYIGSTKFLMDRVALNDYAELAWQRSSKQSHEGVLRQIAAIMKSGDRTKELNKITAPTLVIHGDKDVLVSPSGGYATTKAIKGSRFVLIAGLGHFISADAVPVLFDLIIGHIQRAVDE
ncbi:alpha/beta fold hydrolase [Acinetobacter sp. YK3]|uniref:alpha/beta fold hydrolase n=1 Tax=Acinetobacter sp. YK3 TaxID=1860097 RepID=UPI00084C56E5|nr:alpha/beta hydrolase [Acinetobacter sp. YK3]OEC91464.1 hypothetical protein A9Z07_17090 [Acinetobacter sp. YK3]